MTRFFAIAICFSMVGMTLVQGGSLDCGCKSGGNGGVHKALGCCHHRVAMATNSGLSIHTPACCSAERGGGHACCPKPANAPKPCCQTMKKSCPACRCAQPAQMVALSGYVNYVPLLRIPVVAAVEVETPAIVLPRFSSEPVAETGPPGPGIGLQTCVLRC